MLQDLKPSSRMGQFRGPSLTDVFQEVPCLWESMNRECYKGLLGTCVCLRQGACQLVTTVRLSATWQQEDVAYLTTSSWPNLRHLDLGSGSMTEAAVNQLSTASWPQLRQLTISHLRGTDGPSKSEIFHCFKGQWGSLRELTCRGMLNKQAIIALTEIDWPMLTSLHVTLCSEAVPALLQGSWPQLKQLCLQGEVDTMLMPHLRMCPWNLLEELQLQRCSISPESALTLAQAQLPCLKRVCLTKVSVQSTWSLCLLSLGEWPELTELVIECAHPTDIDEAECSFYQWLTTVGTWPRLQTLHLGLFLPADNVHILLQAPHWPVLTSLTFCGYHKDLAAVIAECMHKWPALKSLTVQTQQTQRDTFGQEISTDLVRRTEIAAQKMAENFPELTFRFQGFRYY